MEQLTKQQMVLLTLLVSFVSSIATGIVTVSLLEQAPPAVTQTINRVVEKIGPSSTTTKTIIVSGDDALVDAVAKASKSLVRIHRDSEVLGLGVIISTNGRILAKTDGAYSEGIKASLSGGNDVSVALLSYEPQTGISTFQAQQGTDLKSTRTYTAIGLANSDSLKLGQGVIALSEKDDLVVASGIVSALPRSADRSKVQVTRIDTSIRDPAFDSQAVLVNLLGEVIGLKSGNTSEAGFIPSNIIKTHATP